MSKFNHYECDQCGTQEQAEHLPDGWLELGWTSSDNPRLVPFSVRGGPHFCQMPCLRLWVEPQPLGN